MGEMQEVLRDANGHFLPGNKESHGRPKNPYSLTSLLRKHGEDVDSDTGLTYAEVLSIQMWQQAVKDGDKAVAQYIFNRLEGMPKERIEHSESTVAQIVLVDGDESTGTAETEAVPDNPG